MNAEAAVIGCLLVHPEALPEIAGELVAEDFSIESCRALFEAAVALAKEGKPVDVVTIVGQAGRQYRQAAKEAMELPTLIYTLPEYIRLTRENTKRRRAREIVMELQGLLDAEVPLEGAQDYAAQLLDVFTWSKAEDELDAGHAIADFFEEQEKERRYIQTGYRRLDTGTYIDRGDYIVIGGRPSAGKTAFAVNMMMHMAQQYNVVFFSLETRKEKIADRLITAYMQLDYGRVKRHQLTPEEKQEAVRRIAGFNKLRLTIVEASGRTVAWMQAKAQKLGAEVVFIDYLGLVKGQGKNRYEVVTNISVDLHIMAQHTGMVVVALSQLNRQGAGGPGRQRRQPDLTELRESGQIEQDADLVILLDNDKDNGRYDVIIAKNKEGVTGTFPFHFDGARQRLTERAITGLPEWEEVEEKTPFENERFA